MAQPVALIVDDEAPMRALFRAFIESEGLTVIEVENGLAALDVIRSERVDIVISDMVMPEVSGLDLLLTIRKEFPKLPVVIVTGKPDVEVAVECMRVGALDYITKPCDFDNFRRVVKNGVASEAPTAVIREKEVRDLRRVDGFTICEVLGEGTMGIVFMAKRDDKPYALKVMKSLVLKPSEIKSRTARFLREIDIATKVRNKHIVEIVKHGTAFEENVPYYAMEYIGGSSLAEHLESDDPLALPERIRIIKEIAIALSAIHEHKIVHRDLKPENILLDEDLTVKLADFGISQTPDSELTMDTGLIGSPAFMSPEAFEGPKVTHQADIFSLGVVSYKLLTGEFPFEGNTLYALARAVAFKKPQHPSALNQELPEYIVDLMADMLQKKTANRVMNADIIIEAIDNQRYQRSGLPVWED